MENITRKEALKKVKASFRDEDLADDLIDKMKKALAKKKQKNEKL
jgi:hypothetical protein